MSMLANRRRPCRHGNLFGIPERNRRSGYETTAECSTCHRRWRVTVAPSTLVPDALRLIWTEVAPRRINRKATA